MATPGPNTALRLLLVGCGIIYAVNAFPLQNITIPLPVGTTNHGTPGLLCTPTQWTDLALFYLFNYVAHAATVLTRPGERSGDYFASVVGSLMCPTLGLYRGIEAILSGAVLVRNNDLKTAARSGALCMVVRGRDWRPVDGDEVSSAVLRRQLVGFWRNKNCDADSVAKAGVEEEDSVHVVTYSPPCLGSKFGCPVFVHRQIIHGTYLLPQGYRFVIVPSDAAFASPPSPNSVIEVSATYNLVKAAIALAQTVYSLLTLYRSRGDQIGQFGYAAFGLTVAPYAVMSAVNLMGNLCQPEYGSLYMVENTIMEEARKRGGVFLGTVGGIVEGGPAVCACGFADGTDVEDLQFTTNDAGTLKATFGVAAPAAIHDRSMVGNGSLVEKTGSVRSSIIHQSHSIRPVPRNLDYTGTENDALLLVPCCSPIQRSSVPLKAADAPPLHRLNKAKLGKTCPPFKHRQWYLTFAPSAMTSVIRRWHIAKYVLTTLVALTPLAIVGIMSHFQPGSISQKESGTWKSYTMQWLAFAVVSGLWWVLDQEGKDARQGITAWVTPTMRVVLYIISASPAVGGFVVVGQMMRRYGVCMWVGD